MERIYSINELRRILLPIFVRYSVKRAILFGSYGRACATEKSDVDLLVDSGLRGLRFIEFTEELRSALGKDIDVFDVSHIEPHSRIEQLEASLEVSQLLGHERVDVTRIYLASLKKDGESNG
jgi:predicted nucleotidyltransferase